ncbi:hypothetical protein DH2020_020024 [Rehmannia glutinosa]|uniref:UDP-glycosyltransferases domain-containing protein n=1 Tax=Rehmannia glutinosa TaxID=99300 RepID=A0ABR0WJ33_REHGL
MYLCSTPINLDSVRKQLDKDSSDDHNNDVVSIELVELHLPSLPQLPPYYHTTKNIPPHLMPTLMEAFQMSSSNFSDIITNLKPDLLIYDGFQPWFAKIASSLNIHSVLFATTGSTAFSFYHHHYTNKTYDSFPFPAIFLTEYEKRDLIAQAGSIKVEDIDEGFAYGILKLSCEIVLIKSCRGIEGKYMDYLSTLCDRKIVPTGPLITTNGEKNQEGGNYSEIMVWLSKKSQFSTLYISFGSENYLSKEQMKELAKGLELSGVNFIWVVRSPIGSEISIEEILSEELLDKINQKGLVLQGWAPQAEILAHSSVGGFISHCGWSSIMESVYFGVPVVAVPLKFDQPVNCRMAVEAGVGVEVMRDENGMFDGNGVAKAINEVILEESGEKRRCKAREMSKKMKMEEEEAFCEVAEELSRISFQTEKSSFSDIINNLKPDLVIYDAFQPCFITRNKLASEFVLLKTSRGLEGKYIDYVSTVRQKRMLTVGPLVTGVCENAKENNSEIDEIGKGLELCDVNFIWVVRFPVEEKTITIEDALPEGFLERVKNRGKIVSGWAPQASILAHDNTSAFISHCGSSSLMESMYFGVPIIAMPMKLAMFVDARMLVEAGAYVEVPRKENDLYYEGEEIAKVINKVIMEESGEGLRRRAQELSEEMRMEEDQEMDETAEQLWQLCLKNKLKE